VCRLQALLLGGKPVVFAANFMRLKEREVIQCKFFGEPEALLMPFQQFPEFNPMPFQEADPACTLGVGL
jgi:hypothetical protein